MDNRSSVDLDLDALAPKQVQIKYKNKAFLVNPLTLEQFAKLYDLSSDMSKIKDNANIKELTAMFSRIETLVKEAIPELKDELLNQPQLTALINLLSTLNTPQDKALAELKKRGINLKKGVKKTPASTS